MLDWTDCHERYFLRLISRHAWLYTEMVATGALLHGDPERLLRFDPAERPLALQLGGSDPADMARCARLAEEHGYDEVNINLGCPSDRVQSGCFGACLMAEPGLVAECVTAMVAATVLPVTLKTRIGIDHRDSYEHLAELVDRTAAAGCGTFIVHARKAWLQGLSPKQNREVPPLRPELVYNLKRDFPDLEVIVNGGIANLEQARRHLQRVDGVMLGRSLYHNPYLLAGVDRLFYGDPHAVPSRRAVVEALLPYVQGQLERGVRLNSIARHLHGLFQSQPGARAWRRALSEQAHRPGAGVEVLEAALARLPEGRLEPLRSRKPQPEPALPE
jgi:tRNA-dihydrouridine synthase A